MNARQPGHVPIIRAPVNFFDDAAAVHATIHRSADK